MSMSPPVLYSPEEFSRLVTHEDDDIELKSGAGAKPLQAAMVAFSNSGGGTIFIGVSDDRAVVGKRLDQGTADTIHEAALTASNLGRYAISEALVGETPIVVVDVEPREDEVAQTSDGRVLKRQGGRNVAIFGSELWDVMSARALKRYERTDSQVPVTAVDESFATDVNAAFGWADPATRVDRWSERGLVHPSGRLTVAGALTLTDPTVTMGAAKFHVDIRSYEDDETTSYVRRATVGGPVQVQAEATTEWILRDIGMELIVTGAFRHDVPRLPSRVVREAVANAVAHRDYSNDRKPIVIEIRPSYVRIASPGTLPPPVTLGTLRDAQSPRNHSVIDVLRRFGLAEDSGQGIDVIEDGMRFELLDDAQFVETADSFEVELKLGGLVSTSERAWLKEFERRGSLLGQDRLLLLAVMREGRITNSRARDVLAVDSVYARSSLKRLRDAGLLTQHGDRGRAYYTLGVIGPDRSPAELVLESARERPLTNERVRELTGLDRVAARRLLKMLVDDGRLEQTGERRATKYVRPKR